MRTWYFSEMAYHPAWDKGLARGSLRVNFPNEVVDPREAGALLNRYLDEFALCDEVGLDIMVNEHHSTATCMTVSVPMALAVIARETKKARLLTLGNPIANRPDPVRVAEEMAWLDCLSGGRLEMGLVKGAPYEIAPANSNPGRLMRRYWEAHDLILKALSTHDGPFSWEGEFFQYRNVNIWPRPIQQPTPPVWMTGMSVETGKLAAEKGHVVGTLLSGGLAKPMYDAYRKRARELGWEAGPDRMAYAAIVGVGTTREEGLRRCAEFPQARRDLLTEQRDVCLGILVRQVAALAEEQQMADPAHAGVERLQLVEHVVRRAGEHRFGIHELLHRRRAVIDRVAVPVRDEAVGARSGFHDGDIGANGVVAGRVGERLRHHGGGAHIVGNDVRAAQPFLPRAAHAHDCGIGEAVGPGLPA